MATMTPMDRVSGLARFMALATLVALALAACGSGDESPDTSLPPGASLPVATPGATSETTEAPGTPLPATQSETAWGPIWDAVPPSFPVPAGAEEADPDAGPVSAAYTVAATSAGPRAIADFYQAALEDRGYSTGLDGRLEDGSFAVWSTNGYGCDALVTVLPRGEETSITVLYGAGCLFE